MPPKRWLVVSVRAPSDELLDPLAEELVASGASAVEEEIDLLTTYFPPPADPERFVRELCDRLQAFMPGEELEMVWRWRRHQDWERRWKRGLRPRRVGRRIVVTPSWAEFEARDGDVVLTVDPEMAFGTGEHATTRLALSLLEDAVRPSDHVLDVGTGTGILAIAAAKLGAGRVEAVEIDPEAIPNAAANLERNGVAGAVRLTRAAVDAAFLARTAPFDVIVANILSGVLEPLLPAFAAALREEGRVILGGILAEEAPEIAAAAAVAGLRLAQEGAEEEWWAGLFTLAATPGHERSPAV